MMIRLTIYAGIALVGATTGLGLYRVDHGGDDWMTIAFQREAELLASSPGSDYGADAYHDVQQALDRVPFWSADYPRARAFSSAIAAERRRGAAGRYPQLGLPDSWPRPGATAGPLTDDANPEGAPPAPATPAEEVAAPQVTVYVTSWCPYCRKLTAHLERRGVTFREVDVERDAAGRDELARKAPYAMGVPVIDVAGEILMGFDVASTDRLLREAGLIPEKE
ncbi:MAG: glutaredoxin domain-containing protein [Myxococcota bacterium]|jgi:glutaredoxin|nr:glutaredoxin domain-containing protein [Myxococcota bacterium]